MTRLNAVTLASLCLFFLSLMVACTSDTETPAQNSVPATSAPEPTFVRATVTRVPIDTPTPTAVAKKQSRFTAEQLADPVFPDWLDPELSDEQPEDEAIFEGWHEYMSNSFVEFTNAGGEPGAIHLCDDGTVFDGNGEIDETILWGVARSPAISSSQWGTVMLTVDILSGFDEVGRTVTVFVVSREDGKVMQTGSTAPAEMKFTRSRLCLERIGA
ncbi:MAG: hypothetical protein J4O05_09670 [Chloroflexi bacterium]|nr:hypothetical protein [Chloroflexota bacterium]